MKALWAHDHIFQISVSREVYSRGKFPYVVWKRYLSFFESLYIIGRCKQIKQNYNLSKLTLSSGKDVTFFFTPPLNTLKAFIFRRKNVRRKIQKIVKNMDVIIARLPSFNGELAAKAAIVQGKPYAIEVVACPWDSLWNYGNWKGRIMAPREYIVTKRLVRKAPYALYVTKNFLQNRYPCKGITVGISNVEIPEPEKLALNNRLASITSKRPLTIGMIGDLGTKIKGIQVAMKALQCVERQLPDCILKVLGGGDPNPWMESAKKLNLADHIEFCGMLSSGQAVFDWLDTVDIYIQPSFQEGLPRALVEAMSRACPALGSTAGGIPELLAPECTHKPGDYQKLSKDILEAYRNPDWRVEQAKRNFEHAAQYAKEIIDAKRSQFWKKFAEFARR